MGRRKGSLNKKTLQLIKQGVLPRNYKPQAGVTIASYGKQHRGMIIKPSSSVTAEPGVIEPMPTLRTDSEILAEIERRYDVYGRMILGTTQGYPRSMIVTGATGIGKSHVADAVIASAREQKPTLQAMSISGPSVSPISLFEQAYRYRAPNNVILLDDSDKIMDSEEGLNLLKALLDTKAVRKVRWLTKNNILNKAGLPDTFQYEGSIVFLTNRNWVDMVERGVGKNVEHVKALLSRSIYLDLGLHEPRHIMIWVRHITETNEILQAMGLSKLQESKALVWLEKHRDDLIELSIRTVEKIGHFMKMDSAHWEQVAEMTLLKQARFS